jgi:hypothetical protein
VALGAGLTVASGIVTALSALDTVSQHHAFEAVRSQTNLDTGYAKQTRTNVALVVTAALAAATTATALWLVDWRGAHGGASAAVGVSPAGAVFRTRF